MKRIFLICGVSLLAISLMSFGGCKEGENEKKSSDDPMAAIPQVKTLVSPENEASVDLNSVDNLVFDWSDATCDCNPSSTYQVVFTMPNDFARPIFVVESDQDGTDTKATLSKTILDDVAKAAGAIGGRDVTIQWAVYAIPVNSTKKAISREIRSITITRFDPTPARVTTLTAPQEGANITLGAVDNVVFSWEAADFSGVGDVKYELLLAKSDGNLNQPQFDTITGNEGRATSISIPRSRLNKIVTELAWVGPIALWDRSGASVELKWAVRATSGTNNDVTVSSAVNNLSLTGYEAYTNPLYTPDFPDPTAIKAPDGYFYAYSTQSARNGAPQYVPIIRSRDLVNWEEVGAALTERPNWKTTPGGGVWAPNINFINGKYYLFYSLAALNDTNEGCGLAISDTPEGPFADCGKLFDVSGIGVENCIDPFYIYDGGKHYLFFGSHKGIYGVEMDDDFFANHLGLEQEDITGSVKKETKFQVVPDGIEAPYIYKKNGYYYMFGSNGKTLGTTPEEITYKITVARSSNIKGPYVTKDGKNWSSGKFADVRDAEPLFVGNKVLRGPGHNGEILTDDNGDEWMIYHAVLASEPTKPGGTVVWRRLCVDKVSWTEDGWCTIGEGTPSTGGIPRPYFQLN